MNKYRLSFIILVCLFVSFSHPILFTSKLDTNKVLQETYIEYPIKNIADSSLLNLKKDINNILDDKYLRKSDYSIAVYSFKTHSMVYSKDIHEPLTPASVTKLFTSFTALEKLGPEFMLGAEVYYDGYITDERNKVLKGNIYIVGKGDVLMTAEDFENLADLVTKTGIKTIEGNVYCESGFYDGKTIRTEYSGDRDQVEPLPPLTSIGIERNEVTVLVKAGASPGSNVKVQLIPNTNTIVTSVSAKVSGSKKINRKSKKRSYNEDLIKSSENYKHITTNDYSNRAGDAEIDFALRRIRNNRNKLSISTKNNPSGKQVIYVSGSIIPNSTYSYRHYVLDPELAAAGFFREKLIAGGIKIKGNASVQKIYGTDKFKSLTKIGSTGKTLIDYLYILNKESDNFLAENIFKLIGAASGSNNDNAAGTVHIRDSIFKAKNIDIANCVINDGSGLSRNNLVTTEALLGILRNIHSAPYFRSFDSCLPIAAVDGTLERRMRRTEADNNVHAKTGTLRNASALAGYVRTDGNDTLAFAMIFNGPNVGYYKNIENKICEKLAEYKRTYGK